MVDRISELASGGAEVEIPAIDTRAVRASMARAHADVSGAVRAMIREFEALNRTQSRVARSGRDFGVGIEASLEQAIRRGKSFSDVLRDVGASLARLALDSVLRGSGPGAGLPVLGRLTDVVSGLVGGAVGAPQVPGGGVGGSAPLLLARGGVIGSPALALLGGGRTALMGEAGPEAVLPLHRGADGRLGVRATGGLAPGSLAPGGAVNVTLNVQTPDAVSFRRSEGQLTALLARTLGRAQRNL